MYLSGFLRNMHFFGGVLIPMFTDWGGVSFQTVLYIQSWFTFCIFAFEIPTGYIADRYGRKLSYVSGMLIGAVGFWMYTLKPQVGYFMVGETLLALSSALISGADEALLYDTLIEENRTSHADSVLSKYRNFQLAGAIPAIIFGSIIGDHVSLILPMRLTACASILAFCVAWFIKEPKVTTSQFPSSRKQINLMAGFRLLRTTPVITPYWLDYVVVNVFARSIIWMFQPILMHAMIPLSYFGLIQAGSMLFEMVVISNMARMDELTKSRNGSLALTRRLTIVGFVVTAIGFSLGPTPVGKILSVVGIILTFGFGLSRRPFYTSIFNAHIPSTIRATTLSTINMVSSIGNAFLNPITENLAVQSFTLACGAYAGVIGFWDRYICRYKR